MEEIQERIKKDIEANPILLYIKGTREQPMCGFSAQAVHVFERLGVPFETRNVLDGSGLREALPQVSNWPTFPQVFVKGELVGGSDIVTEMYEKGELQPLVEKALGSTKN
ncbi:MAG: monothiol glutaredoxin, Grx4 family [Candidatus Lindowbacteria bacterium RIFCSPLOWO2_12_FULL_62_27]|nr:MAG: monothiol glutaredoxin, Grx4 family [Candidatus Lindowbacteria bacterium RIFCSPLOWO2_02_FULL_62_12]OGH63093.1 MAG: monothiol glutaredoxin, Grx4 family [Candidatus Lindowbacteria bacterium RIFCSPLOWO2_12_FULL_62_27]